MAPDDSWCLIPIAPAFSCFARVVRIVWKSRLTTDDGGGHASKTRSNDTLIHSVRAAHVPGGTYITISICLAFLHLTAAGPPWLLPDLPARFLASLVVFWPPCLLPDISSDFFGFPAVGFFVSHYDCHHRGYGYRHGVRLYINIAIVVIIRVAAIVATSVCPSSSPPPSSSYFVLASRYDCQNNRQCTPQPL